MWILSFIDVYIYGAFDIAYGVLNLVRQRIQEGSVAADPFYIVSFLHQCTYTWNGNNTESVVLLKSDPFLCLLIRLQIESLTLLTSWWVLAPSERETSDFFHLVCMFVCVYAFLYVILEIILYVILYVILCGYVYVFLYVILCTCVCMCIFYFSQLHFYFKCVFELVRLLRLQSQ